MRVNIKKVFKYGCIVPFSAVFIFIIVIFVIDKVIPSEARRALPGSATDIKEYYSDSGFTGDFTRLLKAKLPYSDFLQYANNLNLKDKYDPDVHGPEYDYIKSGIGVDVDWWDEPWNFDNCYFKYKPEDDYLVRVKYYNGYVYFAALSW